MPTPPISHFAIRSGMRWWRVAAIAWLLVVFAVAVHQWKFWREGSVDTNVLALLPSDERAPEVGLATQRLADGVSRRVVLMLGAKEWEEARGAAEMMRKGIDSLGVPLNEQRMVGGPTGSLDFYRPWRDRLLTSQQRQWLTAVPDATLQQQALSSLYQPTAQARLSEWAADPLGLWVQWWAERATESRARPRDGELWLSADGMEWAVLTYEITGSAFSLSGTAIYGDALKAALERVHADWPQVQLLRAGVPLHAEAAAVQAHGEINTIGWGSLAGVLFLTWLAFRSLRPIALVGLSLLTGCAVALSVTAWLFGEVHLLTLVFGASLVGVAEDYGIHYFATRQSQPLEHPRSLMRSLLPTLWLALATSVIAYLALGFASFPGLRQMAVFSAVGLAAAMLTVVCWFPWLDRGMVPLSRFASAFGATLIRWPRLPWTTRFQVGYAAFGLLLALGISQIKTQDDVRQLQNPPVELVRQQRQIGEMLGLPSPAQFYLVQGATDEEVLQREEALRHRLDILVARGSFTGYSAVSDWVPSVARQSQDAALTRIAESRVLQGVNAALGESLERPMFTQEALRVAQWQVQPIAAAAKSLWLGEVNGQLMSVVMLRGLNDLQMLPVLAQQAEGLEGVQWIDKPEEISSLLKRYRISMAWLLIAGHVLVLLALCWRFGRQAWRAWLPTVVASVAVVAILGWVGLPLQLFNVLALVLLLGVGVDYGIFLLEHEEDGSAWLAIIVGAVSTWLSFGLLCLSSTPALKAFGLTLMVGLPIVLVLAPMFRSSASVDSALFKNHHHK